MNCIYSAGLVITDITSSGGTVSWTDYGSVGYEWVITTSALPDGSNAVASRTGANTLATGLASGTGYIVFLRSTCGGGNSDWSSGISFSTLITNDECDTAVPVTVNNDDLCGSVTSGTVTGATASGVTSTCFGTADDDVWFSFTAAAASQVVSLIDITGSTSDMYFAVWSGTCAAPVLVPNSCSDPQTATINGLVAGQPYLLQVYTWTATPDQTSAFNVCIGAANIGIGELADAPTVEVYPNPVSDVLNVRSVDASAVNVRIIDVMGRVVAEQAMTRTIPIEWLSAGTYTLIASDTHGQAVARARFVKE